VSQGIDDNTKLKRIVAYSRDFIICVLDNKVTSRFLPEDLAEIFAKYSETLIKSVETNTSKAISAIDSNNYITKLMDEGLSEDELGFKYSFFNQILIGAELPVTLDDYTDEEVSPTGKKPMLKKLREFFGKKIKDPIFGKIIDWVLDGINWLLDSIGSALPGIGAVQEIKNGFELGKKIHDDKKS
jgi:hypothetical protein